MNIFEQDDVDAYLSEFYQNQKYEDLNQQILNVFKIIDDFIKNNDKKNEELSQLANQILPPLLEIMPILSLPWNPISTDLIYSKIRRMIQIPYKAFYDDDDDTDCYWLLKNSYKYVLKYINDQYDYHMELAINCSAYKIIDFLLQRGITLTKNINCNSTPNFFQMYDFLISREIEINLQNYLRPCIEKNNYELFQKLTDKIGDVKWYCEPYTCDRNDYETDYRIPSTLKKNEEWTIKILKNTKLIPEYWLVYIESNMEKVVQYLIEQNCPTYKNGINNIHPMSKNITAYKLAKCRFDFRMLNVAIRIHGKDSELVKFIKTQL